MFCLKVAIVTSSLQSISYAQEFATKAKQAIAIDYASGRLMYQKCADQKMPPSSMSKLMTLYVAFTNIKNGQLKEDEEFIVSKKAWQRGGSTMFLKEGQKVKVKDLLYGIAVVSGNDACITLAEGMFGSEESFVEEMNNIAKLIGLNDSCFKNSSGWPEEGHLMTVNDLAKLAIKIYQDFPEYYKIFAEKEFTYNGITQKNYNEILFKNELVDGVKTGTTKSSGYSVVISAKEDERRTFLVLTSLANSKQRLEEGNRLLRYTSNNFKFKRIFKKDDIIDSLDVLFGKINKVELFAPFDIDILYSRSEESDTKVRVLHKKKIEAPIEIGQELAQIVIEVPGQESKIISINSVSKVERVGWLKERWYKLRNFF